MKTLFKAAAAVLVFLTLVCAALEISARVYLFHFTKPSVFNEYASLDQLRKKGTFKYPLAANHQFLGTYPRPNYVLDKNRHNSLGFRGDEIVLPKPKGEYRIVCLGGSTTYTSEVKDYKLSYPYLLQQILQEQGYKHVTVVNGGCGGWTSWQTLISFALRVIDLDPDLIIIYDGINDVHERIVWPPENYIGDKSRNMVRNVSINQGWIKYAHKSTFLRILLIKKGILISESSIENLAGWKNKASLARIFSEQKAAKIYPSGIFKEVSVQQMLETNKPVYFERNLRSIIAIAKSRGIQTLLASFSLSPEFANVPNPIPIPSSSEYQGAIREQNEVMRKIAIDTNVPFFDFDAVFPKDRKYYTDGIHVSVEGSRLKASLFARFLTHFGIVKPAEPA
jgi:lysophospholipase L1-like esterase